MKHQREFARDIHSQQLHRIFHGEFSRSRYFIEISLGDVVSVSWQFAKTFRLIFPFSKVDYRNTLPKCRNIPFPSCVYLFKYIIESSYIAFRYQSIHITEKSIMLIELSGTVLMVLHTDLLHSHRRLLIFSIFFTALHVNGYFKAQNLKQETRETLRGKAVETPEKIVETLGETCGNTMGNGKKLLGNWRTITSRESP